MPGATHPKYEKALRENPPSVMGREEQYPGIFSDYDGDEIPTADDPDPMEPGNTESIEEVQLSDELRKIFDVQREYDQARQDTKEALEDMPGTVQSRTKTPYSIINKLRRKRIGGEKGITDIAGTRLIVDTHEDLEMAVEKIENGAVGEVLEKDDHYQSEGNPYSAVHFIVSVDGKPVEIQVVTDRIHEIADAAHTPYKEGHLNADRQRELTGLAERADKGDEQAAKKIDQILQDEEELKRQLSTRKNAAPSSTLKAFGALAGAIGLTAILKS
jgi:ppGpp synthetase/RelA/SpoT-type nucleotidyltranferase